MHRVVVFLLLLATVLSTSFVIDGVKSAPAASGKLTGLPPLQTHIVFRLQNSTHAQLESGCNERGEFILPIVDASVKWSQPMPQGTYLLQTLPAMSCERLPFELASHIASAAILARSAWDACLCLNNQFCNATESVPEGPLSRIVSRRLSQPRQRKPRVELLLGRLSRVQTLPPAALEQ